MLVLLLEITGNLEEFTQLDRTPDYNHQYDDVNSVIQDLCEVLQETGIVYFRVGGFGQDIWPVDVAIDLATIIEQLPEVISSISEEHYPFQLDFYEQGVERRLTFEKEDKYIRVSCYSSTSWIPHPSSILLTKENILSQFLKLKNFYVQAVKIVCPKLSGSDLFTKWYETSF